MLRRLLHAWRIAWRLARGRDLPAPRIRVLEAMYFPGMRDIRFDWTFPEGWPPLRAYASWEALMLEAERFDDVTRASVYVTWPCRRS